jgi:hypothetical protein
MAGDLKKLSAIEEQVWDIARSLPETRFGQRIVLLTHKSVDYLFVEQVRFSIYTHSFYPKIKGIELELVFESTDWDVQVEDSWEKIHYKLFIVNGFSSRDELVRATLRNIEHDVTVIRLIGQSSLEIQDKMNFKELVGIGDRSGASLKKFFRERRIVSGALKLAHFNHYLMNAVLNPSAIREFLETGVVPDGYFAEDQYQFSNDSVYCPNKLYYLPGEDQFRFEVRVSRDAGSSEAESVALIKRVLDLVFRDSNLYADSEGEDAGICEVLGLSQDDLDKIWEPFHLWHESYDDVRMSEELSEMFRNWVRPEVVEVVIEESAVDPSRGTKVWESTNVAKYSETLSEWRNTKFEKIDPKAYLKRLQGQYGVTSDVEVDEEYSIFLDTALEDLDLTLRTYNALNRKGVHTLRQLIALTESELLEIENLGPQGIEEIPKKINELGLGFLLESPAWPFVQD